ncbi:uncharacterized protein LOC113321778 [Papaver somniferum]|uniref:uncharacterized protein LOC113321778 n=1 Tax=Papaver somniferum TaxID=3469 RepID=UPI000E6F5B65|nr:uncharacterized protein LOC113321778 [Papaver somniferum]
MSSSSWSTTHASKSTNNEAGISQESIIECTNNQQQECDQENRVYNEFMNVRRKKNFVCKEKIGKEIVNVVDGLELHTNVFSPSEQNKIVNFVHQLEKQEQAIKQRPVADPCNHGKGKGRVSIQFGCCYDNAPEENPPRIRRDIPANPIPSILQDMIRKLVELHVVPPSCVPDSCVIQIFHVGDIMLPHIDNDDFARPISIVSLLSECDIGFGSNIIKQGSDLSGPIAVPLPVGSVLVLKRNAADVAKHCVPAVQSEMILIIFRKIKEWNRPHGFVVEPNLRRLAPLSYESDDSYVLPFDVKTPFPTPPATGYKRKAWRLGPRLFERSTKRS